LAPIFEISDAPCQIVTRVKGEADPSRLARQILNPRCSAEGWLQTVIALDGATKQSIIKGKSADADDDDGDADFTQLMVDDDDGDSAAAAQGDGIEVHFNQLSRVVAGSRPKLPISWGDAAASAASVVLLMAGAALLFLAWKNRATAAPHAAVA
jgi:hypothetical protein